jgi:hypothetical protein
MTMYNVTQCTKSALFWFITRLRVVIFFTDVSGQRIGPIFMRQETAINVSE